MENDKSKTNIPISAQMVRELRDVTGAGMMDCKKALVACNGDINSACDFLRIKSGVKAEGVSSRTASEGRLVFSHVDSVGVLAEINCETDFVARGDDFAEFCMNWAKAVATDKNCDTSMNGDNGEQARKSLVMKVGENVNFGRTQILDASGNIEFYIHTGNKIGAMVDYHGDDEKTVRDICMHIAAMRPEYLRMEDVPEDKLQKQREIFIAQSAELGKDPIMAEKIAEGKLKKHFAERVLETQLYAKDNSVTVGNVLNNAGIRINAFHWMVIGGGNI